MGAMAAGRVIEPKHSAGRQKTILKPVGGFGDLLPPPSIESSTTKTSCRYMPPACPRESMPRVLSQFDVKIAHWPSCDTIARGVYQKERMLGSLSWATLLRWWANRQTVAPCPANATSV